MFDPIYKKVVIDSREHNNITNNISTSKSGISKQDIINYNPLENLARDSAVSSTFYEILSIIQAYELISCSPLADNSQCVCLDLDHTDGFLKAIQGRFAYSFTYCLHTKNLYTVGNALDHTRINNVGGSPHSISAICRTRNMNGIDLAFATQKPSKELSVNEAVACIAVLSRFGTLTYRIDDYTSSLCRDIFAFIYSWFDKVELYKPAMMSCINRGAYIVARNKRKLPLEEYTTESNNLLQSMIDIFEEERKISKNSIKNSINNIKAFNLNEYENYYMGL